MERIRSGPGLAGSGRDGEDPAAAGRATQVPGPPPLPASRRATPRRLVPRLWPSLLTGSLLGAGAVGLALLPTLAASAPLLLIALRPTVSVLMLVGGQVAFLPALLVAAVFRALVDVGYFGLARNNIRSLLLRRLGTSRLVAALSRKEAQRPLLWFCLVNTNAAVDAALGAGSVPMRRFLRFLVPGSLLSSAAYLLAANAVAPWMRGVVRWLDNHASLLILLGVALAACHAALLLVTRRLRAARGTRSDNGTRSGTGTRSGRVPRRERRAAAR